MRTPALAQWVGNTTDVHGATFHVYSTADPLMVYLAPLDRQRVGVYAGRGELHRPIRARAYGRRHLMPGRRTGT